MALEGISLWIKNNGTFIISVEKFCLYLNRIAQEPKNLYVCSTLVNYGSGQEGKQLGLGNRKVLPAAEEGKFPVSTAIKTQQSNRQGIFPLSRKSTIASAKTPTEIGIGLLQRQHSHLAFPGVRNFSHSGLQSMHSSETGQPEGQGQKSSSQNLPQGSLLLLPAETPQAPTAAAARSQVHFSHSDRSEQKRHRAKRQEQISLWDMVSNSQESSEV